MSKNNSFDLINFYEYADTAPKYRNPKGNVTGMFHPFRMCLVGSSGAGKTNVLLNIIQKLACFDKIVVFAMMPDEPLYRLLKRAFPSKVNITDALEELPDLTDVENNSPSADEQTLLVFDDVVAMDSKVQNRIKQYFLAGRKRNFSVCYISQSYFDIPKFIRKNANYIVMKGTFLSRDFKCIVRDFSSSTYTAEQIAGMQQLAERNGSFFWIDVTTRIPEARFRMGFINVFQ